MDNKNLSELYKNLPKLPQRQDALNTQILDAVAILNRLGLYDVADLIRVIKSNIKNGG